MALLVVFALFQPLSFAAKSKGGPPVPEEVRKAEAALPENPSVKPEKTRKILIFDRCEGFVHSCIPLASKTFEMMGEKSGAYSSVVSSDMAMFDRENLQQFDAILLNNTTRLKFKNPKHRQALMDFVRGGKGLIGIHAASDNFGNWPEASEMMGGQFDGHPWRSGGTWAVKIDDPDHPLTRAFGGKGFKINDEIYQVKGGYSRDTLRVLLSLDMSYEGNHNVKDVKRTDNDFGIAWIRKFGKGRIFYCSLGHNHHVYWNKTVLRHYLDGIQYALGDLPADDTPSTIVNRHKPFVDIIGYEYGKDRSALSFIENTLRTASPIRRATTEDRLIATISASEATVACKQFVCRMLRICGTEKCVPVLAPLLTDNDLSHMARYALQTLDSPRVNPVLIKMLRDAPTSLKVGIVGTLGARGVAAAVPSIIELLSSDDSELVSASLTALANIATPSAANALKKAKITGHAAELSDARLLCAERMVAVGNRAGAFAIYKSLFSPDQPSMVQIAAIRGLVLYDGERALPLVVNALKGSDNLLKKDMVRVIPDLPPGADVTQKIAELLPQLNNDVQIALITALTARGDTAAASAIADMAKRANEDVKETALRALGALGGTVAPQVLLSALRDGGLAGNVAEESLCLLNNTKLASILISALKKESDPKMSGRLIEILTVRGEKSALPLFLDELKHSSSLVREAAAGALGRMGSVSDMPLLLKALKNPTVTSAEKRELLKALASIATRAGDSGEAVHAVTDSMENADTKTKVALIGVLRVIGGTEALDAVRVELAGDVPELRKAAVRTMGAWKDDAPLSDLRSIAEASNNTTMRILAVRGCVGLLSNVSTRPERERVKLLADVMDFATRAEEKKAVLGSLQHIPCRAALDMAVKYEDDSELGNEARLARDKIRVAMRAKAAVTYKASASSRKSEAKNAIDQKEHTRWTTGHKMRPGDWYALDLGNVFNITSVMLDAAKSKTDYPRGLEIFVSKDGKKWGKPVYHGKPAGTPTHIAFKKPLRTRHIKFVQTGKSDRWWWSIAEIKIIHD